MDEVIIFSSTMLGVAFGRHTGKLIQHGEKRDDFLQNGPFVEYIPTKKRKPRVICDKDYLLILRGIDLPDPGDPFVTGESGKYASVYSSSSTLPGDRVHRYVGDGIVSFDPGVVAAFNGFINQHAHLFIADYRKQRDSVPVIRQPTRHPMVSGEDESAPIEDPIECIFDPFILEDQRRRSLAMVVQRPGQSAFRMAVIGAYEGKCCITGCSEPEPLEAAHIVPYSGPDSDHVCNGLLLRLDLHALFDAFLLTIDHEHRVRLNSRLLGGYYECLEGKALRLPREIRLRPSAEALRQHWVAFDDKNDDPHRRSGED